jgi:hypothetical protein
VSLAFWGLPPDWTQGALGLRKRKVV